MSKFDHITTHIYSLYYTAGNAPEQSICIDVPFTIKKILFKPLNCYFTVENATAAPDVVSVYNPFVVYCDLVNRPIGYSGHIANAVGAAAGAAAQWVAVNNDVTFTLHNHIELHGQPVKFWLGASLNAGNRFITCPFTGVITVTVEYHSEY